MRRFVDVYGERPAHLVVLLACVAVAGYAATFLLGDPALLTVLIWFVSAALVHDLLIFPLYAAADQVLSTVVRRLPDARVSIINYVRVPALGAGLTLLMFLPGIIRQGDPAISTPPASINSPTSVDGSFWSPCWCRSLL